jgi:hypothetical protein
MLVFDTAFGAWFIRAPSLQTFTLRYRSSVTHGMCEEGKRTGRSVAHLSALVENLDKQEAGREEHTEIGPSELIRNYVHGDAKTLLIAFSRNDCAVTAEEIRFEYVRSLTHYFIHSFSAEVVVEIRFLVP